MIAIKALLTYLLTYFLGNESTPAIMIISFVLKNCGSVTGAGCTTHEEQLHGSPVCGLVHSISSLHWSPA